MKYKLLIVFLSIKWMFRINIGDYVWYQRNKYVVINGASSESWKLAGYENDNESYVPRKDCKKVLTPKNLIHSFNSGYNFYMDYWYDIWKREGIKDWMKKCNIW